MRLKDIHNLLASVDVGPSGTIISRRSGQNFECQPKDRKEMVEDALGLKIYQYKIKRIRKKVGTNGTQ